MASYEQVGAVDGVVAGAAGKGLPALPQRKRLDHRGPLRNDVLSAWYFITICAAERVHYGRAVSMKPPQPNAFTPPPHTPFMVHASDMLDAARFRHANGKWSLALFLVMPDHLHLIAHFPAGDAAGSSNPPYRGMDWVIADFKRWLSAKFGLRFQRDFWDTRLRDEAHYAEKFSYICRNPVRKGLCALACDWPYVIAFDRETGEERQHK